MQLSNYEKRKIDIWEQLRMIEGELFLLTARSGELDSESHSRIGRLMWRTYPPGQRVAAPRTSVGFFGCSVS
jgi:hypothetical protein